MTAVHRVRGFSIVELMIAMAISLGLTLALATLLSRSSRASATLDRTSRQIESGRYALDLLSGQIRMAGYYGEMALSGATFSTPSPCVAPTPGAGFSTSPVTVPVGLQGYQGTSADPAPSCASAALPGSAALVVRRLSSTTTAVAAIAPSTTYLQVSRCGNDPATVPFVASQNASDFTLQNFACNAPVAVRAYETRLFYVASCSTCGQDTIPTLKKLEYTAGVASVTPLVEGIEEMHVEYGFDTNGDGVPDVYRTGLDGVAGSPTNAWENVMTARVWAVARTTEVTQGYQDTKTYNLGVFGTRGPYLDGYKRRVYSMVVRLNNPAGLRE